MAPAAKSVKAMKRDTLIDFVELNVSSPNQTLTFFLLETLSGRADVGINAKT
jgi:dihydroorotate dehydrogenase